MPTPTPTPTQPTAPNPADQGMVFDAAPVSAATTIPATAQPSNSDPNQGMVFDSAPVQDAATTPAPATDWNSYAPIHFDPNDSVFIKAVKGLNSIGAGIGSGVLSTLQGGAKIINKIMPPMESDVRDPNSKLEPTVPKSVTDFLQQKQNELATQNSENPILNTSGKGIEGLMEFFTGEGELKGAAYSEQLLKSAKVAKFLETASPKMLKAIEIGTNALRAGVTQGGISTVKTGGDVGEGAKEGALTAGLVGGLGAVSGTVKAIMNSPTIQSIQAPLQQGIRDILSDTAGKLGVDTPTAQSIRDAAQQVSDSVRARGSAMYKALDEISGGQAQRFRDAAQNISDKLGDIVGLDDDKEADLIAKQKAIDAAHKAMLDKLQAAGHPRDMLDQADAVWTQQGALSDLNNSIRQSTSGMRPELASGENSSPETVNQKVLFTKINRLNDRGRLAQAIGSDNAANLLNHVDQSYLAAQRIAARNAWIGKAAKVVGLGGAAGAAVGELHHLFGIGSN